MKTYLIHAYIKPTAREDGFQPAVIATDGFETMKRLVKTLEKGGWSVVAVNVREKETRYTDLKPNEFRPRKTK